MQLRGSWSSSSIPQARALGRASKRQEPRGLEAPPEQIQRDEAGAAAEGVGREAGSEHVPEARSSCIQHGAPLSRHGFSREATAGNWLKEIWPRLPRFPAR